MAQGGLLWEPAPARVERSNLTGFLRWLRQRGHVFGSNNGSDDGSCEDSYKELWRWSVGDLETFWGGVAEFCGVRWRAPYDRVLGDASMPGAVWFPGARLNYAEHALARTGNGTAVCSVREDGTETSLSWDELRAQVGACRAGLVRLGVGPGDRVAGLLPNSSHAVVAFLATASLGAVWSSCSPDFGARSVRDRFAQIEPTVLLAVDGYRYGGREFDVRPTVDSLRAGLPTLKATVLVPYTGTGTGIGTSGDGAGGGMLGWSELLAEPAEPSFEAVPFDHPLWVLYSSGTTGLPKAIVHGHGGILLEHLKALRMHCDLGPSDRFFWFTTTGWMMWNFLTSGLTAGARIVLYDGSPAYPDSSVLWRLAERHGITLFGTSAPYLLSCMKAGLRPGREHDLGSIEMLGSTGAPLPADGFEWVYREVNRDLLLGSISGGTDVCTALVGSVPTLPVRSGEIQAPWLGVRAEAFDPSGRSLVGEVGELVVTAPIPSMPVFLWNDPEGVRLRDSYYGVYPGVWRHGDWVRITPHGSVVVSGRSDSTLNRGGVRMGTSEFYRVVEELDEITDSLVIDTSDPGGESGEGGDGRESGELLLFVVLREGITLDTGLRDRLRSLIRGQLSPRHVPDRILAVPEVPRTLNGKKCEVPVKRILTGVPVEAALSIDALSNPTAIEVFARMAGGSAARSTSSSMGPPTRLAPSPPDENAPDST